MKAFLENVLQRLGQAYWVEIKTADPECIYYFGPFLTLKEAQQEKVGYQEDLEQEGAAGIEVEIKRCRPRELTITEDWGNLNGYAEEPKATD
jgi:hypothetical protein